ncbi:MAG TPA: Ig-like domain-containing protein [Methylotenera sp.]|nr:Ig-like domain-containing protein [Methylotenera sp.]
MPVDAAAPSLTVDIVDTSLNNADTSSVVTFTFSEAPVGFTAADITAVGGSISGFTATANPLVYTATYTATPGFSGTGSVSVANNTYTDAAGNNGTGGSDTVPVDAAPPVISAQTFSYTENQVTGATVATVVATDATIYRFAATGTNTSADGFYQISNAGVITITATGVASGANNFETAPNSRNYGVTVLDAAGNSSSATITLNETNVNETPVASADAYTSVEGTTTLKATVLGNDTDPDGDTLTVTQFATTTSGSGALVANGTNTITTALGGTVVMNSDGTYTYTAPARNHGDATPDIDSFAYKANDGSLDSPWTTVNITITDTNPIANNDVDSVGIGSTVAGNVITGAGGVTADTLNVDSPFNLTNVVLTQGTLVSNTLGAGNVRTIVTTNGTLMIDQDDGSYSYNLATPAAISVASPTAVSSFTNAGFGVYGFDSTDGYITTGTPNSGLDLTDLNATSAARVSYSSGGIGPDDDLTPSANQSRIEQGEELVFALPTTTKSATVTVTDLAADEVALWETYDASGALISSGSWPGGGAQSFTITAGTPFSYTVVRSGAGSSDEFRVTGISIQPEPSSVPDIFTYTLTDSDGDTSTATLTMNYDSNTTANNDTAFVFEAGINATATQDGGTQEAANSEIATGNILANDTGIASTTNITDVNGVTPVGGVITINNPNYTVQIYTQTVGAFVKGDYVVTLTGNTTEGVDDVIALNYQLQNSLTGELDNATLTVNIVDDVPTVQDAIVQVQQGVLPKQNLVFVIDSSGSMAGEVKNVAANGTVTIQNRLQATLQAVTAVINEYFSQGGNVSITLIDFDATAANRGTYTTAASAIAALNTPANFVVGGGTNYEAALQTAQAAMTPPVVGERYTTYFISDGVPTVGDITDPAANGYRAFATANNVTTYAIGIASDISNPTELNNIHNVDSDNSGVKDNAIIVTNVATLDEVLLASVPTTFGGSVAGSTANSSLNFGADGGYISQLIMRLDTNGDNVPDADVTFNFNPTTGAITVVGGGAPQAGIPSPSDTITLNDARGFEDGILIFNFRTGEYVYQTAGFAAEGEQFDIKFTATDGDGDTASGKQTVQIVDGKPDANNDIDTLRGGQTFFEGNVMSAIGTDGGDSVALTSFSSNRSGEDNPGDGGRVSSIVFKGVTFDLTTLVGSTAALGGNYTVTNIGGVNTLTWTASAGGSSLVFNASGYYRYTPPTADISNNVVGASTTYNLDTAGNITTAATAGMTLTAIARASATEGSATVNPVGGDGTGVTGGGNNNNQIDDLESLVITFNTALHPRGVQGVVINVDASNSNLGGTNAFNYNVYDVHGDLIGQFASNAEGNVTIPFAGIGKIIVDSGTIDTSSYPGSAGSIFSVTYQTILATGGTPAPAPEVISYTLLDTDGDTSTATLTLNNIIDDFSGTAANNTINGTARNENISGLAGDDTINAGAGYDIVRGGDGNDTIDGGDNDDQLYGNAGNDNISGSTGNDLMYGDAGNDTLNGNDGNDFISGGDGSDTINGGIGADIIIGGAGNDTLTGGSVGIVDTFRWELADRGTTSAPATDVITDFDPAAVGAGGDVLDLRDLLSGESHTGVDSGNLASYLHFEVVGANTVIHISNNGGFSNGFSPTKDVQKITLTDVDLVTGFADDNAIIQNLLTNNKLITD